MSILDTILAGYANQPTSSTGTTYQPYDEERFINQLRDEQYEEGMSLEDFHARHYSDIERFRSRGRRGVTVPVTNGRYAWR